MFDLFFKIIFYYFHHHLSIYQCLFSVLEVGGLNLILSFLDQNYESMDLSIVP